MNSYWDRLNTLTATRAALCVNVDPHPEVLRAWDLPVSVDGLERCSRSLVAALGQKVAVFKPQSAFFERYGSAGVAALERLLADIRQAGALSILDVKRGDIGSTMAAYADAYLADGSPLAADAITVSPFLGFGSLEPAFERAHETGRGVYVLARTSNPEGSAVQLARGEHGSVAQDVIDQAARRNDASGRNAIGVVIGATHSSLGCDVSGFNASILVPGIGAQGGTMEALPALFGPSVGLLLPAVGRELLLAGPNRQILDVRLAFWAGKL